jgi:hypothetical protein
MRLNSKVTWGLAWAGLALVVAVPSADFLTGRLGSSTAAVVTSTTDPVKTSSVTTTRTSNGITITPGGTTPPATADSPPADPVDKLLKSGKSLPSYITDDKAASVEPTKVAALDPAATVAPAPVAAAPTPFPSWARPHNAPAARQAAEPTVIVDETSVAKAPSSSPKPAPQSTQVATTGPVPPANIPESGNWDPGLASYLAKNGLLDDDGRSTANVTQANAQDDYDPDGFFLSDGPNNDAAAKRRARLRALFGDDCYDEATDTDLCEDDADGSPYEQF